MGNTANRPDINSMAESYTDYDENSINRGTTILPKPLLKFHSVHGTNVELLNDSRIARRRNSFCKGLAFSNRPISVNEIVCIRLYEVGKNWSGVLRIGVTNVDPASFRDIELPKFACPDLISKSGYWAKALAERYSIEKSILHFFVNSSGEMFYGINGESKGLFLSGINIDLPIWIIVDIYGNSVGVEFVSDLNILNSFNTSFSTSPTTIQENPNEITENTELANSTNAMSCSTSGNNLGLISSHSPRNVNNLLTPSTSDVRATSTPSNNSSNTNRMRFHVVKGINITLQADDLIATRKHGEYYLGYVFTERPIKVFEKITIVILQVEEAFTGSLAFGLTSCDPIDVPASRLPIDSDELLERPEYWVSIKDVGATSVMGDKLSFYIDNAGQVFFSKNDAPFRVIMHVDISVKLWCFFDLYGTTRKIQLLDETFDSQENERNRRAASEGSSIQIELNGSVAASIPTHVHIPRTRPSSVYNLDTLRVALPPSFDSSIPITRPTTTNTITTTTTTNSSTSSNPISVANRAVFNISPTSSAPSSYVSSLTEAERDLLNRFRTPITTSNSLRQRSYDRPSTTSNSFSGITTSSNPNFDIRDQQDLPYRHHYSANSRHRDRDPPSQTAAAPPSNKSTTPRRSFIRTMDSSTPSLSTTSRQPSTSTNYAPSSPSRYSPTKTSFASKNPFEMDSPRPISSTTTMATKKSVDEIDENQTTNFITECTICMNSPVNSVIYRCGHMCMCFSCAKEMQNRSGDCPICRTAIIDVIRCFPSF